MNIYVYVYAYYEITDFADEPDLIKNNILEEDKVLKVLKEYKGYQLIELL